MIYYKCVTPNLTSIITSHVFECPSQLVVQYKVGEWVYPEQYRTRLMVFGNLNDAKNFQDKINYPSFIYKCEIGNIYKKGIFVSFISRYTIHNIISYSQRAKQHKKYCTDLSSLPKGTVLTDRVKLLEKV